MSFQGGVLGTLHRRPEGLEDLTQGQQGSAGHRPASWPRASSMPSSQDLAPLMLNSGTGGSLVSPRWGHGRCTHRRSLCSPRPRSNGRTLDGLLPGPQPLEGRDSISLLLGVEHRRLAVRKAAPFLKQTEDAQGGRLLSMLFTTRRTHRVTDLARPRNFRRKESFSEADPGPDGLTSAASP